MIVKINSKKALVYVICFCCFSHLFSQTKLLRGTVVSIKQDVTGITIQNSTSGVASITNSLGNFAIKVALNDTLVFSAVQFKRKVLPINSRVFNSAFIRVDLEEFVNELNEVVVQPFDLSGNLGSDLLGLTLEKDVSAEALGLPNADVRIISQSENKLNDADHGKFAYFYVIALTINLNKIMNRLNGKTKMLKKRVELDKAYANVQGVEERFIDSVMINHLKIPKNDFYDFIYFCEMDDEFKTAIAANDELKLWQFLIDKSTAYRKNNALD